jgi:hypothetical protein
MNGSSVLVFDQRENSNNKKSRSEICFSESMLLNRRVELFRQTGQTVQEMQIHILVG